MEALSSKELTQLLLHWGKGDKAALDKLMPFVYGELHRLAHHYMQGERPGHTLQTTALINEAYLRLIDYRKMQWQDRAHFFAVAAQVMRRILVDSARSCHEAKRGGGVQKLSLDEAVAVSQEKSAEVIAVDDALKDLSALDPRKSQIVELRYFGGLNIEETAEVLKISPTTVQREWRSAKAFLHHAVTGEGTKDH
jgi:RNA polymerase sigma-70 factor (ECF subfamily)